MSTVRRKTTRRRAAMFLNTQGSLPSEGGSPFNEYLNALEKADSFTKVLSLGLRSELTFFRRPLDAVHYRKVTRKISEILEEIVVPLMEEDRGSYPEANGLLPMDNMKFTYKFLTNMQYFSAIGKFQLRDPFQLNELVPEERNHVLVGLYLRMPPDLEHLPEVGEFPKGAIPFIRVTYRIVRGNRLYTGETREKWKWNLKIPTDNPVLLGIRNGESGRLAIEVVPPY